jgi:hypothetical protein
LRHEAVILRRTSLHFVYVYFRRVCEPGILSPPMLRPGGRGAGVLQKSRT